MPVLTCPVPGCNHATADVADAGGAVLLKFHLDTAHAAAAPPAAAAAAHTERQSKLQIDRPRISAGATSEDWSHFLRDWSTYKDVCRVTDAQAKKIIFECCDENLKHLMYGQYTSQQQANSSEDDLLKSVKRLAVVYESTITHRLRLSESIQSPGQNIHGYLAVLRSLARSCNLSIKCSCDLNVDYSDSVIRDQLIKGMSDDTDRQRLLAEPKSEDLSLEEVVEFLHRLETSHRPIQASNLTAQTSNFSKTCWRCGKASHPSNDNKTREKVCSAYNVTCDKCKQKGHFQKCCPKCVDCDTWGHMSKSFMRCTKHQKKSKEKTEDKDKGDTSGAVIQLCEIQTDVSREKGFIMQQSQLHCTTGECLCTINGTNHGVVKGYNFAPIPNFIFEGSQWIQKNNPSHDMVNVRMSVGVEDHKEFRHPVSSPAHLKQISVPAAIDSGAMAITVPPKTAYDLGLRRADLIPCKTRMKSAGGTDLGTIGAFVACLEATTKEGKVVRSKQLAYVCQKVQSFYLSKTAMQDLGIVPRKLEPTVSVCEEADDDEDGCRCPPRGSVPPPCPDKLPEGLTDKPEDIPKIKAWLLDTFASTVFNTCEHQALPLMTGEPLRIYIDPKAKPVAIHNTTSVPFHWEAQVKSDLDRDVRIGVIEKVPANTPAVWCSRMVITAKANGSPRRAVDLQPLNKWSVRQTHPIEAPFVLASRIPSNKYLSVVDQWNGYHSIPLHEEDKDYTQFATQWGRYRYKKAPQGYLASGDGYNHRYDAILTDFRNKERCVDDTAIYSDTILSSFQDLYRYFIICAKNGVILNSEKFQFCQQEVEFAGLTVTQDSIKPSQKLVNSIMQFPNPKNISDARAWFGLVEQGSWAFSRASIMAPYRHLLRPKNKFFWNDELTGLFQLSKKEIVRQIVLGVKHFTPNLPTCLATDYSGVGIGFFLLQKHCSCTGTTPTCCKSGWQLTLVGSRFLHDAETRYAPIEGELLAVVYGLHQTRFYVHGCPDLTIATDHKPLLGILNDRSLADIANRRLLNLKEKTLGFRFAVVHVPGKKHLGADAASQYPGAPAELLKLPGEPVTSGIEVDTFYDGLSTPELRHNLLNGLCTVEDTSDSDIMECRTIEDCMGAIKSVPFTTWDQVRTVTASDPLMQQLHNVIVDGFPDDARQLAANLRPYARYSDSLCIADGVVMSGNRIVIPPVLRQKMLLGLHAAHQGIAAMKSRAQDSIWWPNITVDISRIRMDCIGCNQRAKSNALLPPSDPPMAEYPFQYVCSDYFHSHGKDYVVLVNRFTNWPIVFESKGGAPGLVNELRKVFSTFGAPMEIATDGGTTYTAEVTQKFFSDWGVSHRLTSVANPHANARAELAVKQVKRMMTDNVSASGSLNEDAFQKAILAYRNTPCPFTRASPATLLFGRQVRDMIPAVVGNYTPHPSWTEMMDHRERALRERVVRGHEAWSEHTRKLPDLCVGDTCFVQNQTGNHPK